jgi:hypothetical protein
MENMFETVASNLSIVITEDAHPPPIERDVLQVVAVLLVQMVAEQVVAIPAIAVKSDDPRF